ncbi:MAG: ShlB/FhaC/HecB family hemolysin secretion/activation protein [Pleurocapsa sp. MO_192.B19]|nr:ShlB/FhaC/HecB family hemolysin secretion/activation protein [Pleurocapsa sp. MO_192.B19]
MIKIKKLIDLLWVIGFNFSVQSLIFTQFINAAQADTNISQKIKMIEFKQIIVSGNTVFSDNELNLYLKKYQQKNINISQINKITKSLTELYVEHGYISSGAFLPQQDITEGVLEIQIIEGQLENLDVKGLKKLKENYINSLMDSVLEKPLNIKELNEKLNILKQNSAIKNVKAELLKGTKPGLSVLILEIEEHSAFQANLSANNYRSPSVGEFQGDLSVSYQNLLGVSDRAFGKYSLTEGFDAYSIGYVIPILKNNGRFSFEYRNGDSKIIENFEEVGIRAESDSVLFRYRQPIIYQPDQELTLGIAFERQNSETFILDNQPFSFTDGPQEGRSVISVLRLTGDWLNRAPNSVYSVSSQLNFGLDIFDATVNENLPDGIFFSWQGQAQWSKTLNQNKDLLLVTRLATQLTPDSLLPLEQFTLGGVGTVRGYRQNQEIGDNAVVGTIEMNVPVFGGVRDSSQLKLIPFFDLGKVWNQDNHDAVYLSSIGMGINWSYQDFWFLRVDWGLPLVNTSDFGNSLQDNGFSFSLEINSF